MDDGHDYQSYLDDAESQGFNGSPYEAWIAGETTETWNGSAHEVIWYA